MKNKKDRHELVSQPIYEVAPEEDILSSPPAKIDPFVLIEHDPGDAQLTGRYSYAEGSWRQLDGQQHRERFRSKRANGGTGQDLASAFPLP